MRLFQILGFVVVCIAGQPLSARACDYYCKEGQTPPNCERWCFNSFVRKIGDEYSIKLLGVPRSIAPDVISKLGIDRSNVFQSKTGLELKGLSKDDVHTLLDQLDTGKTGVKSLAK